MTTKKKMQLPTKPTTIVKKAKADPSASDGFTEQGSKVTAVKAKVGTKDIRLVLPVPMIDAIDEAAQPQPPQRFDKLTRTAWIKQAIAEKLERDND